MTTSIKDTLDTLLLILGVITTIFIITGLCNELFHIHPLFNGLLEITNGISYVSNSSLSVYLKCILITFFISFGGISIQIQTLSLLDKKKIKFLPYLITRIIHGLLSTLIFTMLYLFLNH